MLCCCLSSAVAPAATSVRTVRIIAAAAINFESVLCFSPLLRLLVPVLMPMSVARDNQIPTVCQAKVETEARSGEGMR